MATGVVTVWQRGERKSEIERSMIRWSSEFPFSPSPLFGSLASKSRQRTSLWSYGPWVPCCILSVNLRPFSVFPNSALLVWTLSFSSDDPPFSPLPPAHRGHRPGHAVGLMHRPWNITRLAGQWQPATHGLRHGPISFQLSQVLVQPGPQVSYTASCLHWVADERKKR